MTPNPTSAPAPQEQEYPRPARPVAAFYTKFRNDHAIKDGESLTFYQWLDFADAWAGSRTLRLAEEAEREPVNIWKSLPRCCGYPKCDGDLVGTSHESGCPLFGNPEPTPAQRVAAWLREKAQ